MMKTIWILIALFVGAHSFADEIEVPEEELARESTLPVFSKRRAVLNRSVLTAERIEVGIGGGIEMNEPFYNDYMMNFQGTYNYNETGGINVQGLIWMPGLSSYGEQLKAGNTTGSHQFQSFDAIKAPHPKWGVFGNYEYIAYYGKISISKQSVMNLNLFGIAGLGYINMGSVSTFGLNLGLGQNFFVTNNLGIRADLRWLIFQGPDATTQTLRPQDTPAASSFGNRIFYNTQIGLSLVYIL